MEIILKDNLTQITTQNTIISEQQQKTINIEEAILSINNGLFDLGITDFQIQKYSDNFYKIVTITN